MDIKDHQMIGANEPCPCGSGSVYLECCLNSNTRYVRDKSGKVIKVDLKFTPSAKKDSSEDGYEVVPLVIVNEEGNVGSSFYAGTFLNALDIPDIKFLISHIEVTKHHLTRAIIPGGRKSKKDFPLVLFSILLFKIDEDDDDFDLAGCGCGKVEDFSMLDEDTIDVALVTLESIKTNLFLILIQKSMTWGLISPMIDDDDEDEE